MGDIIKIKLMAKYYVDDRKLNHIYFNIQYT